MQYKYGYVGSATPGVIQARPLALPTIANPFLHALRDSALCAGVVLAKGTAFVAPATAARLRERIGDMLHVLVGRSAILRLMFRPSGVDVAVLALDPQVLRELGIAVHDAAPAADRRCVFGWRGTWRRGARVLVKTVCRLVGGSVTVNLSTGTALRIDVADRALGLALMLPEAFDEIASADLFAEGKAPTPEAVGALEGDTGLSQLGRSDNNARFT